MPFLIDRSMTSLGMFTPRALSTAERKRGLPLMSPPPRRAETVISLITLVHTLDFFESEASFLCLIFDQRLWPDIAHFLTRPAGGREGHALSGAGRHEGGPHPGVAAAGL